MTLIRESELYNPSKYFVINHQGEQGTRFRSILILTHIHKENLFHFSFLETVHVQDQSCFERSTAGGTTILSPSPRGSSYIPASRQIFHFN